MIGRKREGGDAGRRAGGRAGRPARAFRRGLEPARPAARRGHAGGLRPLGSTPPVFELDPAETRRAISRLQPFWSAGAPALPHVEEQVIAGASGPVRIRLDDPGAPAPAPAVAFLHGGGWVLCDIDLYDGVARQLAVRSGLRVLSVDYGLAPEHPFPAGLGDCVAALRWAAAEGAAAFGVDLARLAVAGDWPAPTSRSQPASRSATKAGRCRAARRSCTGRSRRMATRLRGAPTGTAPTC